MSTIIEFKNVVKEYKSGDHILRAMDNVNFEIEEGEFVVILGPSGAGKSTLLNLMGGLDSVTSGQIIVNNQNVEKFDDNQLTEYRAKNVGFIFQFYNLVMNLSVEDNILLPQTMNGKTKSQLKKELDEILEITGLTEKRKSMPNQLSGGQQQRVAIARAVIGNPKVILADEPTGNLDKKSTGEIMDLFRRLNKEKGLTILQVTHSEECATYGTRTVVLDSGRTVG